MVILLLFLMIYYCWYYYYDTMKSNGTAFAHITDWLHLINCVVSEIFALPKCLNIIWYDRFIYVTKIFHVCTYLTDYFLSHIQSVPTLLCNDWNPLQREVFHHLAKDLFFSFSVNWTDLNYCICPIIVINC